MPIRRGELKKVLAKSGLVISGPNDTGDWGETKIIFEDGGGDFGKGPAPKEKTDQDTGDWGSETKIIFEDGNDFNR